MPFQAVLWDLDGTIVNTENVFAQVIEELNQHYGFHFPTSHVSDAGHCLKTVWNHIITHNKPAVDFQTWVNTICQATMEKLDESILQKDVKDVIQTLHSSQITQICVSNSMKIFIEAALTKTNLRPYFKGIVGRDSVEHGKPAPDLYLKALSDYHLEPHHTIVIEDSIVGAQAAHAAGLPVIAVPTHEDGVITITNAIFSTVHRREILSFLFPNHTVNEI